MVPGDEDDAAGRPQVDEDHPAHGAEEAGVMVADADADGAAGATPGVEHQQGGHHVLDSGA